MVKAPIPISSRLAYASCELIGMATQVKIDIEAEVLMGIWLYSVPTSGHHGDILH